MRRSLPKLAEHVPDSVFLELGFDPDKHLSTGEDVHRNSDADHLQRGKSIGRLRRSGGVKRLSLDMRQRGGTRANISSSTMGMLTRMGMSSRDPELRQWWHQIYHGWRRDAFHI